jgi:hypothetical protein
MLVNEFDRAWVEALLDKLVSRKGAFAPRDKTPLTPDEISVLDTACEAIEPLAETARSVTFDTIELAHAIARELANRRRQAT